tara:strand:+ start:74635 stop:75123 length:489 start_codon:yes stop_codon:yes gene_type:complete
MMKKILLLILLIPKLLYSQNKLFYVEANAGVSTTVNYEDEVVDIVDMSVTYENNDRFMGSLSIGTNIPMGDYSLIDIQIGLSYPYILTGKVGVGSYYGKREQIAIVLGVRPYPLMGYAQLNIRPNTGLHFVVCGEIGTGGDISLGTRSMFNFGLRYPIKGGM